MREWKRWNQHALQQPFSVLSLTANGVSGDQWRNNLNVGHVGGLPLSQIINNQLTMWKAFQFSNRRTPGPPFPAIGHCEITAAYPNHLDHLGLPRAHAARH